MCLRVVMKTVSVILGKVEEFELEERRVVSVCRKTGAFSMQMGLLIRTRNGQFS